MRPDQFGLPPVDAIRDFAVCVTEQLTSALQTFRVTPDAAPQIVLSEALSDLRLGEQPRHESLPH